MTTLALCGAALNDDEARRVAGLVARAKALTALDLRDNAIGEVGGQALLGAIAEHPGLTRVDLRGNPLSESVERALTDVVAANPRLTFVESPCPDDDERSRRMAFVCANRDRGAALARGAPRQPRGKDAVREALDALAAVEGPIDADPRFDAWADAAARVLRRRTREARPEPVVRPAIRAPLRAPPAETSRMFQRHLCYVCKARIEAAHPSYNLMCMSCGDLNAQKRDWSVDLSGKTFVVTGARTKIGFALGRRLLRSGAKLIATTRFPHDCARRYAGEGFGADQVQVHALDLRDLAAVEAFCARLRSELTSLDGLVNVAAQTVWRPPEQYAHLFPVESLSEAALPEAWGPLVKGSASPQLLRALEPEVRKLLPAGALHELPLELPPKTDERETNSWRSTVTEVDTRELVEVHVINAVAPFVLARELLPLLRGAEGPRWIVNVSAVEGQFYRWWKGANHPHCNMAKAALNMLVRTTAGDLAKEGVYVTAVDTGWVSNDNPLPIKERMDASGFEVPLDIEDGAARIYDPIARSVADDEHVYGVFLKDYDAAPW